MLVVANVQGHPCTGLLAYSCSRSGLSFSRGPESAAVWPPYQGIDLCVLDVAPPPGGCAAPAWTSCDNPSSWRHHTVIELAKQGDVPADAAPPDALGVRERLRVRPSP